MARQRNAIGMAFRMRADDDLTLNAGLPLCDFSGDLDQYCKETLYFCDFSGEGSRPPVTPLDLPMLSGNYISYYCFMENFKILASLCSSSDSFETYLVGNPKGRFSRDEVQLVCMI